MSPGLADISPTVGGDCDTNFLHGKRIVRTGYTASKEGGWTIDYMDGNVLKRVVFNYNDLGLWIQWRGEVGKLSKEDILRDKLSEFLNNIGDNNYVVDMNGNKLVFLDKDDKPVFTMSEEEVKMVGIEEQIRNFPEKVIDFGDRSFFNIHMRLFFFSEDNK